MRESTADWPRYKDYIVAILLLRFLSNWRDRTLSVYRRKYNGDEIRITRAMSRERFVVPDDCTFKRLYDQRGTRSLGATINSLLLRLVEVNPRKLDGIFKSTDFNSADLGTVETRNARLVNLLEIFAELDTKPADVPATEWMGGLAESLVNQFAEDARQRDLNYTPPEIAGLITQLLDPQPGDRIYDPACGTGGFLIRAARAIKSEDFALFGHEPNQSTWELCRINLMLQGMDSARIIKSDPIRNPILAADDTLQKFNVVMADPPFSLANWGTESIEYDRLNRFRRGVPPQSSGDYAFITHAVETMDPVNGRAAVVVPLGTLFRGGSEGLIRGRLIEEGLLEGVVRLPPNLYFGSGISVALLLFRANRSDKSVFFIDASREFAPARSRNRLRDQDLEMIVATWKSRKEQARYSYLATYPEIESQDFNLHVPLYIKVPEEDKADLIELAANMDDLQKQQTTIIDELNSAVARLLE
jgi:type I restriction enzyme M protein